jgi:hypothetical protein
VRTASGTAPGVGIVTGVFVVPGTWVDTPSFELLPRIAMMRIGAISVPGFRKLGSQSLFHSHFLA